jgi:hypothetical protein
MATFRVRLRREGDWEITGLPPVCARCGAPATRSVSHLFMVNWTRQRVTLPLCEEHWLRRKLRLLISVGYVCAILALIGGLYSVQLLLRSSDAVMVAYWIIFVPFLVCSGIIRMVFLFRRILPVRITDDYIELKNVSPAFVEAVEAEEEALRQRFIRDADESFVTPPRKDDRIQPGNGEYQPG